ncbi:hypothetical protein PYW08_010494 [Mythimna loreyi]|uniref:Uncharacterized protein n=1 Tax=Mythimna loreyi TaxID=667449 RepID=A0ACC2Q6L5_9NEOP|nr:hypothetical protein PYW08_010494 [Mythimna loreyi]
MQFVLILIVLYAGFTHSLTWDIVVARSNNLEFYNEGAVSANGEPNCRCNAGKTGERCDVSVCHNYCLHGECSIVADEPSCRCDAGYSGKRCEVYACDDYCLHEGVCSLNNNSEPVCRCTERYSGERCSVFRKGYQWLPMVDDELPPNAIIGGYDNEDIYIARAYHKGSLCPGKYVKSLGKAYIPWGGAEHYKTEDFEILCGFNATWVNVNSNFIPDNAFIGGRTGGDDEIGGEPLYVCRMEVQSGVVCGKAYGRSHLCYLPYDGSEKQFSAYEVLVVPNDEI